MVSDFLQAVTNNVGFHWTLSLHLTLGAEGVVEAGTTMTGAEMGCHEITTAMDMETKTTCPSKTDNLLIMLINPPCHMTRVQTWH